MNTAYHLEKLSTMHHYCTIMLSMLVMDDQTIHTSVLVLMPQVVENHAGVSARRHRFNHNVIHVHAYICRLGWVSRSLIVPRRIVAY